MATLKQSRSFGANKLAALASRGYAGLVATITRFFSAKCISVVQIDAAKAARSAQLFERALHEDSILELDWLWYAANMTSSARQRYCLRRALEINPGSEMAHRALAKLALHENR
jgi:hypothetical protein